ncbi:hypothetical protein CDL12_14759 [Handroanthus impetiginosus]|uniref:Uncharacterized protein n=1 Tax=Handroanthus impetiginosus TaxID=429701 RepID=A0A2G9H540_9LAMI|nr:hypothetical protein CDL12_14759 [Handroanthus impetiginosus]
MAKKLMINVFVFIFLIVSMTTVEAVGPAYIPCCRGNVVDCCPKGMKKGHAVHFPRKYKASPSLHELIPTIP